MLLILQFPRGRALKVRHKPFPIMLNLSLFCTFTRSQLCFPQYILMGKLVYIFLHCCYTTQPSIMQFKQEGRLFLTHINTKKVFLSGGQAVLFLVAVQGLRQLATCGSCFRNQWIPQICISKLMEGQWKQWTVCKFPQIHGFRADTLLPCTVYWVEFRHVVTCHCQEDQEM